MAYEFLDELHSSVKKLDLIKDKMLSFDKNSNKSQLTYAKLVDDLKVILEIRNEQL